MKIVSYQQFKLAITSLEKLMSKRMKTNCIIVKKEEVYSMIITFYVNNKGKKGTMHQYLRNLILQLIRN